MQSVKSCAVHLLCQRFRQRAFERPPTAVRWLACLLWMLSTTASTTACNSCGAEQPNATPGSSASPRNATTVPSAASTSSASTTSPPLPPPLYTGAIVPVEPQPEARHHVDVKQLPKPFATDSARRSPQVVPAPIDAKLRVPPGFSVKVFASGLDRPRWLALAPNGDVLVTETRANRIVRLRDKDGDGAADERSTFANADNGLAIPFGMAFTGGYFFLGNSHEVRRYTFSPTQSALRGKGERIAELPGGGYRQHWTRNVIASPEGEQLYVSIGSRSNVDEEPLPRASVQRMDLDGRNMRTVASGLRNPVGLALHPQTGELYTTVNERDGLGDDLVPDYFTRVRDGEFFGWPYAYLQPQLLDPRQLRAGKSSNATLAAKTRTPDVLFQAHSAALGVQFYSGTTFPERYRNGAFVAFRGSWNRHQGTGYKLVFIPFDKGRPRSHYEDFLTGFLLDPQGPTTWGRPVGVLVARDGSLLFTEEMNGRIFRIQHDGT